MSLLGDFFRAVGQLGDPRFLKVFWLSILLTFGLLVGLFLGWGWLISLIPATGFSAWGYDLAFLDIVVEVLAYSAGFLGLVFLMFPAAALFIGLFLEDIADAVEDKHYPGLPEAGRMGFWEMLGDGLLFTGALVLANIGGVFLYAFLIMTVVLAPFAPFVFLAINGWMLGRQYFELTAARRLGAKRARELRRENMWGVWAAGVAMAFGLSIPILNLAVPVLGVAAATHAFHRAIGTPGSRPDYG